MSEDKSVFVLAVSYEPINEGTESIDDILGVFDDEKLIDERIEFLKNHEDFDNMTQFRKMEFTLNEITQYYVKEG